MHGRLEVLVAIPVAVGLLDDNVALEQQTFQYFLYVKGGVLGIAHTERNVLEVAEQCHVAGFGFFVHCILAVSIRILQQDRLLAADLQ